MLQQASEAEATNAEEDPMGDDVQQDVAESSEEEDPLAESSEEEDPLSESEPE